MNVASQDRGPAPPDWDRSLNILIIHEALPRPDRCGCDVRLMQVLQELREQGHAVTYLGRSGMECERYSHNLEKLGIPVYSNDAERLRFVGINAPERWKFQSVLSERPFDLAILFHWFWTGISVSEHYIDTIRAFSPRTRIAVLTDDQHALREERLARSSGLLSDHLRAADFKQREHEVYYAADIVLAISNADIRGIQTSHPGVRSELLTMSADLVRPQPFEPRKGVLFVGDFANRTTIESAEWLLRAIWPEVCERLPNAQLFIAGSSSDSCGLKIPPGVRLLGHIDNLTELYQQCRVFVAPTRSCTGVQTKILGALRHGLPTVTTPAGAEGLGLVHRSGALLAEYPCEFANEIVRLHADEAEWNTASELAQSHVRREFSPEKLRAQIRDLTGSVPQIEPRPFDPGHVFSVLRVEKEFPQTLDASDPKTRFIFRNTGYLRLGEELLSQGRPVEAREQLLHVFPYVYGRIPTGEFFARLFVNLFRCEELLGKRNECFLTAAQACLSASQSSGKRRIISSTRQAHLPVISVIIPTFNRSAVLASCLAALDHQSLAKSQYEVIVVDDGSEDATERLCRTLQPGFQFRYHRQENSGAGAARNFGLKKARGQYVLFVNDDTIASETLLSEHLRAHASCPGKRVAVLGDFAYSPLADRRALTYLLSKRPFLFPQVGMTEGFYQGSAYFVTCNLSLLRQAVLDAGSFDCRFRVAEDTELGARLTTRGYKVLYWPAARAIHDHLNLKTADLVRRARSYGPPTLLLLQKHPWLLADGNGPFGRLDAAWKAKTAAYLEQSCRQVEEAQGASARLDDFNFSTLPAGSNGDVTPSAAEITSLLEKAITHIHWFYLLEAMLKELDKKNPRQAEVRNPTHASAEEVRPSCPR